MQAITRCGVSGSTQFHTLWKLPSLPLTERFGRYDPNKRLSFDQELVISVPTGHVQLRYQLDPSILYTATEYSFRTAASEKSRRGVTFFMDFLRRVTAGRKFKSAVDVGGNDLFVAKELKEFAESQTVIDPICAELDGQIVDGIKVYGRFIEQVDLAHDLERPDLVVCRHTLEHIADPRAVVDQWFSQCDPDCLYVAEIPCFDNLVEAQRFDAIFHQHYHYYDLNSFRQLIWAAGGEYISHAFNHQGSCGGALLIAFRRAKKSQSQPTLDLEQRIGYLERRIRRYQEQMTAMSDLLSQLPQPAYGYGAGLMLATLAYHLRSDFASLQCILDDDPCRDGATYENVPVTVRHTSKAAPPPNSSYFITSLENVRPIFRRICELSPRRILVPLLN